MDAQCSQVGKNMFMPVPLLYAHREIKDRYPELFPNL